jgi:hypothetical protein
VGEGLLVYEGFNPGVHYPGTYLAGGYNRLKTEIEGGVIENEDLMNMPNWLSLKFRPIGGEWFLNLLTQMAFHSRLAAESYNRGLGATGHYCGSLAGQTGWVKGWRRTGAASQGPSPSGASCPDGFRETQNSRRSRIQTGRYSTQTIP